MLFCQLDDEDHLTRLRQNFHKLIHLRIWIESIYDICNLGVIFL